MVEAMACGTPVVTTNWGAAPELVDDGVTGLPPRQRRRPRRRHRPRRRARPGGVPGPGRGPLLGRGHGARLRGRLRAPIAASEVDPVDFHYGRSVITMAAVNAMPCRPLALPSRSTISTSPSTDREILRGVSLAVGPGRAPRPHGPQRLGEVDAGQRPARQPRLRGHRRPDPARRRGHHRRCRPTSGPPAGLFLGFQHPEEIPGVSVFNFLRQAMAAPQGHRRLLGARGAHAAHGVDASASAWTTASRSAT